MTPVLAVGTWLAEDFNEHTAGSTAAVVGIVLILALLILWAWWRLTRRNG